MFSRKNVAFDDGDCEIIPNATSPQDEAKLLPSDVIEGFTPQMKQRFQEVVCTITGEKSMDDQVLEEVTRNTLSDNLAAIQKLTVLPKEDLVELAKPIIDLEHERIKTGQAEIKSNEKKVKRYIKSINAFVALESVKAKLQDKQFQRVYELERAQQAIRQTEEKTKRARLLTDDREKERVAKLERTKMTTAATSQQTAIAKRKMAVDQKKIETKERALEVKERKLTLKEDHIRSSLKLDSSQGALEEENVGDKKAKSSELHRLAAGLKKGESAEVDGKTLEKRAIYLKAIDYNPDNPLPYLGIANDMSKTDRVEIAGRNLNQIKVYKLAIQKGPRRFEGYNNLGLVLDRPFVSINGAKKCKRDLFVEALRIEPYNPKACVSLGALFRDPDDFETILGERMTQKLCFKRAIEYEPDNPKAWHNLSIVLRPGETIRIANIRWDVTKESARSQYEHLRRQQTQNS